MFRDVSPFWMWVKAALFLVAGLLASAGILLEMPTPRIAFLLLVAIVAFSRLYYFMFYVIEKYLDPSFRFAGISSFLIYLWRRRR